MSSRNIQSKLETYIISITVIGIAGLAISWLPYLAGKINLSYPIIFIGMGMLLYSLVDELPWPNPFNRETETVHLTELIIIIALMNTGLKIDRKFTFKEWKVPLRLVSVTMLLCIAIIAALAYYLLHFDIASSVLLGAVMAPTDPVLASDVQVDAPNKGNSDEVRFSLTAEAGLNDGMSFPFTWMAIGLGIYLHEDTSWLSTWLFKDLLYRIIAGIALGFVFGKLITYIFFKLPEKFEVFHVRDGLVALCTTLAVYGLSELISGYGFIAVVVAAITIRNYEMGHEYHNKLHAFTDQVERILLAILLILFGGSLVNGILEYLNWQMALLAIGFLLFIRPVAGILGLLGITLAKRKKFAISFFGIKGIGSFFYLSFALSEVEFAHKAEIWSLTAFVVLISIIVHGLSASFILNRVNK